MQINRTLLGRLYSLQDPCSLHKCEYPNRFFLRLAKSWLLVSASCRPLAEVTWSSASLIVSAAYTKLNRVTIRMAHINDFLNILHIFTVFHGFPLFKSIHQCDYNILDTRSQRIGSLYLDTARDLLLLSGCPELCLGYRMPRAFIWGGGEMTTLSVNRLLQLT